MFGDDSSSSSSSESDGADDDEEDSGQSKVLGSASCSTCKVAFDSLLEQRAHFKLDWHR